MTHSVEREGGGTVFLVEPHDCEGQAAKLRELLKRSICYLQMVDVNESDVYYTDTKARQLLRDIEAALVVDMGGK